MLPSSVLRACDALREHLDQTDWSELSSGRRRILEVFLRLASVEGYSAVTMRTLAKSANVKAASIYFHFPDGKSEIVSESLRWHYSRWGYTVLNEIQAAASVEEFWDKLVLSVLHHQVTLPAADLWDLLVRMDRVGGFLEPDFRREIDAWLTLCLQLFEAAATEMGYKPDRQTIKLIMSILDASTSWCECLDHENLFEKCGRKAIELTRSILRDQQG